MKKNPTKPTKHANKSKKFNLRPINPIAQAVTKAIVGAGISLSLSSFAIAQISQNEGQGTPSNEVMEELRVIARQTERYRTNQSSMSKLTEDLLNTPQTVKTMSRELLEDRGLTSLNDAPPEQFQGSL